MNREAQATKQAPMPTIAKTWALRGAKLCVVLLRRLSRESWLVASFGFCDIPLVWNIGRLVVKPLCSLFQLLHYPLEACGHRYCEIPRSYPCYHYELMHATWLRGSVQPDST